MKDQRRVACVLAVALCVILGSGCRGAQIRQLEKRVDQLETRVAVLESQVAARPHE